MRKILLIVLSILTYSFSYSQNFSAGAIAGINATQISGDNLSGFDKAGVLIGGFSKLTVSEKLQLQFEINYSQKGSRKNPQTDQGDHDFFLLRLNYIEIPIVGLFKHGKFTFEFGGYYGQLVHEHIEDENGQFDIPDALNQFTTNDLGLIAGLYFNLMPSLSMNWRVSNSILAVRKYDSGANYLFNDGMFHSALSINLRYEFFQK